VSTGIGDRPMLYAWLAGRFRAGFASPAPGRAFMRHLLHVDVPFDDLETHTVEANLQLADALGIERHYETALRYSRADAAVVADLLARAARPCAVLHLSAKFAYKNWRTDAWHQLAAWLVAQGMHVVFTGADEPGERAAIDAVRARLPRAATSDATSLTLPQVGCLLANATLYVGPDTVVTHAAAATGVPTIALFGPSNPVKWGPWPHGFAARTSPFNFKGSQIVGNVHLLQGEGACVPCRNEGCERHVASPSRCLQELPAERVIDAARAILHHRPTRRLAH
jgi:heptosyltransferase-3